MKTQTMTLAVAGLTFAMEYTDPAVQGYCLDYLTDAPPQFILRTTPEEVALEQRRLPDCVPAYCEYVCLQRELAEKLPDYDGFFLHAGALEVGGRAFLFLAPSGVGKTTHLRLWLKHCGSRVRIINGDKPIVRRQGGVFNVYGAPWNGREHLGENCAAPVAGLCFLTRAQTPRMEPIPPVDRLLAIRTQIYYPKEQAHAERFLSLLDDFLTATPCWRLYCNTEEESAKVAFQTLIGDEAEHEGETYAI